ncbi:MAG: hypothetical protein J6I62_09235 [Selenomonadaceae bacterium]|nr:hypothetical protein [Selenomonadaceae bacterium]
MGLCPTAVNADQSVFAYGSTSWSVLAYETLATLKRRCFSNPTKGSARGTRPP